MEFYLGDYNDILIDKNDHLYIIIDSNYNMVKMQRKNIITPYNGIFTFNNELEHEYYNIVANKMRTAGFDGFMDWVTKCINEYSSYVYHDDYDKPVIYKCIIFITDNNTVKQYIKNIFNNFGFNIEMYNLKHKNLLF